MLIYAFSICTTYSKTTIGIQKHIRFLFTMLIRSMGPKHPKILSIIQHAPIGSESLVLRMIEILMENGKLAKILINLVKSLSMEKTLDPRYLVLVLPELSKVCSDSLQHINKV